MPLTFTGRNVSLHSEVGPSLIDIAVGLSRMPRFAGQTRRWWSVLDHTLFCDELVIASDHVPTMLPGAHDDESSRVMFRLAVLLHDAHESLTADVPTPFKNETLRATQETLDYKITTAFFPGGWSAYKAWGRVVKCIDERSLQAEAMFVGPPAEPDTIRSAFRIQPEHEPQVEADVAILRRRLGQGAWLGVPPSGELPPGAHPGVTEYLTRYLELR